MNSPNDIIISDHFDTIKIHQDELFLLIIVKSKNDFTI